MLYKTFTFTLLLISLFSLFGSIFTQQTESPKIKKLNKIDDIINNIKPKECGTNAHFTNSRGNERCIDNCPNYKQGPKFCTRELYFGSFCQCNSGFIFLNGTDGACVRPGDCPQK